MKIEIHIKKDKSSNDTDDLYKADVKVRYWFDNRWIRVVSSLCGIVSLLISGIAIAMSCPKTNLEIDYLGVIVAIVSLVVAVFVGVQIYQSFNLKRDIDEQNNRLLNDAKESFSKEVYELKNSIKELQSLRPIFEKELEKSKNEILGKNFIDTLSLATFLQGITSSDIKRKIQTCFNSFYSTKEAKSSVTNSLAYEYLMMFSNEAIKNSNIKDVFIDISGELDSKEVEYFMQQVPETAINIKVFLTELLNDIRKRNS